MRLLTFWLNKLEARKHEKLKKKIGQLRTDKQFEIINKAPIEKIMWYERKIIQLEKLLNKGRKIR